jgi:hypothetical protein
MNSVKNDCSVAKRACASHSKALRTKKPPIKGQRSKPAGMLSKIHKQKQKRFDQGAQIRTVT